MFEECGEKNIIKNISHSKYITFVDFIRSNPGLVRRNQTGVFVAKLVA